MLASEIDSLWDSEADLAESLWDFSSDVKLFVPSALLDSEIESLNEADSLALATIDSLAEAEVL
ncbi:hypothetical protein LEQ_2309c [Ligilactobacillus equi DPC 6820]|uniref:Uncharacterized protein n=1 Tax=Ligilactobacillus equi DPC 6820 TaxID=1392007 RepID=V7HY72_9LACO|nr:hypothetical protein LEQ_2309c [Ligilactobacillus equi DPC 6820]